MVLSLLVTYALEHTTQRQERSHGATSETRVSGRSYRGNRAACQVILQRQTPGEARARPGCSSGRDERNPRGEGGHAVYTVKGNPEGGGGT